LLTMPTGEVVKIGRYSGNNEVPLFAVDGYSRSNKSRSPLFS
jgi:hypothetical protein